MASEFKTGILMDLESEYQIRQFHNLGVRFTKLKIFDRAFPYEQCEEDCRLRRLVIKI